jgi:hypothetical protein
MILIYALSAVIVVLLALLITNHFKKKKFIGTLENLIHVSTTDLNTKEQSIKGKESIIEQFNAVINNQK